MAKQLYLLISLIFLLACADRSKKAENKKPVFKSTFESFNYTPPAPINGKKKAAIVIGSAGFDAFVINADTAGRWELEKASYGESNVINNTVTIENIRKGIEKYRDSITIRGITKDDIQILISSSAAENKKLKSIIDELSTTYSFISVTEEEEAYYAFRAVVPSEFIKESFAVDMGSGNTKISWQEGSKVKTLDTFGSMFFIDSLDHTKVSSSIKNLIESIDTENTYNCFMLGGVPYELSRDLQKFNDRYTVIKKFDSVDASTPKLQSGLAILKGIKNGTSCENFIFDWNSNFAIGYLLEMD